MGRPVAAAMASAVCSARGRGLLTMPAGRSAATRAASSAAWRRPVSLSGVSAGCSTRATFSAVSPWRTINRLIDAPFAGVGHYWCPLLLSEETMFDALNRLAADPEGRPPRPSATLVVLRESPAGPEVLLLRRAE